MKDEHFTAVTNEVQIMFQMHVIHLQCSLATFPSWKYIKSKIISVWDSKSCSISLFHYRLSWQNIQDRLLWKSPARAELHWCPTELKQQAAEPRDWWQQGGTLRLARQNSPPTRRRRILYISIFQTTQVSSCFLLYSHLHIQIIGTCGLALNLIENNLSFPHCYSRYIARIDFIRIAGFCCNAGVGFFQQCSLFQAPNYKLGTWRSDF